MLLQTLAVLLIMAHAAQAGNRHVAAVSCAAREECSSRLDEEVWATTRDHMHNETSPCENFWDYACGEWSAAPYYDHVDTFGAIGNYYARQIHNLLSGSNANVGEMRTPLLIDKLRAYYAACRGTTVGYLEMSEYYAEMPEMANWHWADMKRAFVEGAQGDPQEFHWLPAVAELRKFGLNGVFIDEAVGMAHNDSAAYVIELEMPADDEDFGSKYEVLDLMVEFGFVTGERPTKWQQRVAAEIYELDFKLKELRASQSSTLVAETMSLATLHQSVSNIDWFTYFSVLFHGAEVPLHLTIEVGGLTYMRQMAELLAHTEERTVYRYVLMKLCKFLLATSPLINEKNCVGQLGVEMSLGLDYLYDRRIYRQQRTTHEDALLSIFQALKQRFDLYLKANKLQLSAEEQAYLQEKLDKMHLRIGNLPRNKPSTYYDDYYDAANISSTNFYWNRWELLRFRTAVQHEPLLSTPPRRLASLDDFYVNDDLRQVRNAPYYVHQRHLLLVPMMFLQMPMYDARLQPVLQFSLVGWILAHEMNHAFETEGILIDAAGNEQAALGAAIKRKTKFADATECLQRTRTDALIERIADVNGFQLAYDAFFDGAPVAAAHWTDFNLQQRFFLNFAQFFCGNLPAAIAHDRDDVRVNQVVANMPEFAIIYNCKQDDKEKCQMWRA